MFKNLIAHKRCCIGCLPCLYCDRLEGIIIHALFARWQEGTSGRLGVSIHYCCRATVIVGAHSERGCYKQYHPHGI